MEKRRRARINQSLNELKKLLLNGSTCRKEVLFMCLMLRAEILPLESFKKHDFIINRLLSCSHNTKLALNILYFCHNSRYYAFNITIP
jgi:hypothetical protein